MIHGPIPKKEIARLHPCYIHLLSNIPRTRLHGLERTLQDPDQRSHFDLPCWHRRAAINKSSGGLRHIKFLGVGTGTLFRILSCIPYTSRYPARCATCSKFDFSWHSLDKQMHTSLLQFVQAAGWCRQHHGYFMSYPAGRLYPAGAVLPCWEPNLHMQRESIVGSVVFPMMIGNRPRGNWSVATWDDCGS